MTARVTLLTDFGTADGYVAAMKGVIAAAAPGIIIDDAAHDIPPGDIEAAAWALAGYWRLYAPPVVHVAVVDPGVGSRRRAIVVDADDRLLVGPDNGLFTRVLAEARHARVIAVDDAAVTPGGPQPAGAMAGAEAGISATFHGRDVFAPLAAHLALGAAPDHVGRPLADPVLLELAGVRRAGGTVHGVVVHVDRFGNLITSIPRDDAVPGARVVACGRDCAILRTYADAEPGELLALIGSRGLLEISVRDGSAAEVLAAGRGAAVIVEAH